MIAQLLLAGLLLTGFLPYDAFAHVYGVGNTTSCKLRADIVISLLPDSTFDIPPKSNRALEPFTNPTCVQRIMITATTGKLIGQKVTYTTSSVEQCTTIALTVGDDNGKLYLQRCALSLTNLAYVPTTNGWLYTAPLITGCMGAKIYAEAPIPTKPDATVPPATITDVRTGDFTHANFKGQQLNTIRFENATFKGADFTDAKLTGIMFKNCDLSGAIFVRSIMTSINLSGCNLSGAQFNKAEIRECDLQHTNMQKTTITDTKISRCNCGGTNLSNAQIYHTQFLGTYGSGTIFSQSRIVNCLFNDAQIDSGSFTQVNFTPEAPFQKGWFSTSNEQSTIFHHVNLTNTNFSGANLTGVIFEADTVFIGTKFIDTLRCHTYFYSKWRPNLTGSKEC
jgi:uncharacterized protein YjbI with pentapeptide repeats